MAPTEQRRNVVPMHIRLNDAQQDAVIADEHLLCVACPGSGKTRVLVEKTRHVATSYPASRIILTTFSRDAALEIRKRLARVLSADEMRRVQVGTFHSLAMVQLRAAGALPQLLSPIEIGHIILRALSESGTDVPFEEAEQAIAACKADSAYADAHYEERLLTRAYQAELDKRGACDYTDLLIRAGAMMAEGGLAPMPSTHVFVDEFQDIDRLQFDWLRHHMDGRVLCAVGDDDQAIYGFRSSLGYAGMMEFAAQTGARIVALETNYRSTRSILDYANRLVCHNVDRVKKRMRDARGEGEAPRFVQVELPEHQISHVIEELDSLCRDNPLPQVLPGRKNYRFGVRKGQAAVLARTNRELSMVERIFIERRVPYLRAGCTLWQRTEPQVFFSLLQSLHAGTSVGIEVALRWARVPDGVLRDLAGENGLWHLLDPLHPAPGRLAGGPVVESLVHEGRGLARKLIPGYGDAAAQGAIYGVAAWMASVMRGTCGHDIEDENAPRRPADIKNLWLVEAAKDLLDGFSGNLAQRISLSRKDNEQNMPRVILSTYHAAKGLEWDNVFLLGVVTGSVPKAGADADHAAIEEERRVFYVAMTRARDRLYLYAHRARGVQPSEFLVEAGLHEPEGEAAQAA